MIKDGRFDYNFKKSGTGTVIYKDGAGQIHDLRFWLDSPEGSRVGMGTWGNPSEHYVHNPANEDTATFLTMSMFSKALDDIPHVLINAIVIEVDNEGVYQVHFEVDRNKITHSIQTK